MNNKYRYPVYSVASCPMDAKSWKAASKKRNCSFDEVKPLNRYMCVPNVEKTELLELCYDQIRPMVQSGTCIELADTGTVNQVKCKMFRKGCPDKPYLSDSIYQHPACLDVNTNDGCFYEDPACPKRATTVGRTDFDEAGSLWIAGVFIGSVALVTIVILVVLFRRRIMAKFFQLTNKGNEPGVAIPLTSSDVEGNQPEVEMPSTSFDVEDWERNTIPESLYEAEMEKALESPNRTNTLSRCVDEHFYSDTRMFRFVRDAITKNKCVLIHGEAGCGKSALMNHVALSLHQNDYDLKAITKFSEIDQDLCSETKTFYLFDDAFGIFNYDISFMDTVEHYSDIKILLRHKHSKLLMTSRSSVYRKLEKFNFSAVFYTIDLNNLAYNDDEKNGIFQIKCGMRFAEHVKKEMECNHKSFPLLCEIFSNFPEVQKTPRFFFSKPDKTFLHFLDTLQNTNILTYFSLVFVVLNGQIQCPIEYEENDNVKKKLMFVKEAGSKHCKNNFSVEDLVEFIEIVVKETKWFKKDNCDIYTFRHMFFYEIIAHHFGKNNKTTLLACMGSKFIAEKVLLKEEFSTGLTISVEIEKLHKRLFADIGISKNLDVFMNACLKNKLFCYVFQQTLKKLSGKIIEDLFWGSKCCEPVTNKCLSENELSEKKMKTHISLQYNDSEWFRQRLLEDRLEIIIENKIIIKKKIKAISWVIGYGVSKILKDIFPKRDMIKGYIVSVFDVVEQIRLLTLAILSEDEDCFDIIVDIVHPKNINSNCLSKSDLNQAMYNKHRKFTPLTIACYKGFSVAIRKLVEDKGSDVNLKDQNGSMPIVLACRLRSSNDCTYLVKKGANLNCTNENGVTPLIAGVMSGNTDIVQFLIEKNVATNQCTVNQCDSKGKSPLYCASKLRQLKIVKLLMQNGANVNITTHHNKTSLYAAAKRGYTDICNVLIEKHANVNKTDWKGRTALYWASKRGYYDIAYYLLTNRASPNNKNDKEKAALHCAALAGYVDIAKALGDNGAVVNIKDVCRRTPLYCASKRGHVEIVRYLIKSGCGSSINTLTVNSKSALFRAAKRNHVDVLKELIAYNADVNLSDEYGESPLYFAAQRGHLEVVSILLQEEAEVDRFCKNKQTALHWASRGGHFSIADLLVKRGADVNLRDVNGETPLLWAAENGHFKVVKMLCENKCKINDFGVDNHTPIYRAAKNGHIEIVEHLLLNGANKTIPDKYGRSPVEIAQRMDHMDIVKILRLPA